MAGEMNEGGGEAQPVHRRNGNGVYRPDANGASQALRNGRLVTVHVNTERGYGGGEAQTLMLARGLVARGHSAVIAARAGSPLAERAAAARLPVRTLSNGSEYSPFAVLRLARILEEFRPDVLHLHTPHAAAFGSLAARVAGVRAVVGSRRAFPRRRQGPIRRLKWRGVRQVVAVSEALRDTLVETGFSPDRVVVVRSGVDFTRVAAAQVRDPRQEFGWSPDALVVASIGNLYPVKGHIRLVRAAERVLTQRPDARFFVAGDGPERAHLEAAIVRAGLAGRFVLAGFRDDALCLLRGADVFVHPSRAEGLGIALVEALALGLPSVATDSPGSLEIGGESSMCTLFVDADGEDGREMAAAILRLLGDEQLRQTLAGNGPGRASLFTVERTLQDTERLYREVLAGK